MAVEKHTSTTKHISRSELRAMENREGLSVFWVARGLPIQVEGVGRVHSMPLDERCFYEPAPAIALRDEWRKTYPDAMVVQEVNYC